MKISTLLAGLSLITGMVAAAGNAATAPKIHSLPKRQSASGSQAPPIPDVPGYNFTMPIDHFTKSDTRTYFNRFWVNDTYYKAGGPVILFDAGEQTFDPVFRAGILAEYNGTVSGPMQLASRLNGLVIGWEHRFYGYSQPFPVNGKTGIPTNGAAGYKYLTVQQGLEDLVYFANNLNTTKLDKNFVITSTANLDPYHSPWIHFGGSYTGARAAWSRQRNPEVFFAGWSSSAPVQVMVDGSSYWTQMSRALPSNCTKDLHAISAYVDQVLTSGNAADIKAVQAGVYLMQPEQTSQIDITPAYRVDAETLVNTMAKAPLDGDFQGYGPGKSVKIFCDYMQTFDTSAYLTARRSLASTADIRDVAYVALQNRGNAKATTGGIVASNGQNGALVGFAAFTWAFRQYMLYKSRWANSIQWYDFTDARATVGENSWTWQTVSQMGWYQYTNLSSPYYATKYNNLQGFADGQRASFPSFKSSDFPANPDTSYPNSFGGWNMKPSNVMFTNGEFDPWRAFGVNSLEAGAPLRKSTTSIPKCNTPTPGSDVFGIVYNGAVHVEDLQLAPNIDKGSEETPRPVFQGLDLFEKAYKAWQPCFNTSRDYIRNGKGVDGNGNTANGTSISAASNTNNGGSSSTSSGSSSSSGTGQNAAGSIRALGYQTFSLLSLGLISVMFATL